MSALDTIVVGGGVVGLSIAYGLAKAGERVRLLDEGDGAFRAARGNFGLVWVQGKGAGKPTYALWSMAAAKLWSGFARELEEIAGLGLQLSQPGGLTLCLDESELDRRSVMMAQLAADVAASGETYPYDILRANAVRELCPHVGPDVVGASFCPLDGHVSPLRLLRALTAALLVLGGELRTGRHVDAIEYRDAKFRIHAGGTTHVAAKLVLAAGLGNAGLAPMVGLNAPVKPIRGQVLISERVAPFLDLPTGSVRQTGDGGVQIGESKEDVGFDDGTTIAELSRIAERAVRMFPVLAGVNIVRTWGALRVMTPDGYPIYQASAECPGAFVVTCHSGVTLAAQHADPLARWIMGDAEPAVLADFKAERFHV
ncbi:FAD-binding oxidoreductase [Bosea sp. (in: a-proteobacteria)]|uniref:NAD(P)/FAD-dependent oxidoreductase n=1 Tax=Bosea sp. (in: a-proteobacteria) TaxID=1871050 RepID=UPI002DDCF140|nr:FAD-binding oxidoreductase [Bosea sp. (in: a-proteobacteria)]HEV2508310.1 FAD-binding oxidoreductase [Bosea sp. (in: a-proteobacteria)]